MERFSIGEHKEIIRILPECAQTTGTSANLVPCDYLSVWELLHGMMLPSGNDAAQVLAIHFGLHILRDRFIAFCKT